VGPTGYPIDIKLKDDFAQGCQRLACGSYDNGNFAS
jgi:hypothetical protein